MAQMAWYHEDSWLTAAFAANTTSILLTAILAFTLPILVHLYIYRSRASTSTPSFLVLGPSGSGKTSLVTKLERGSPAQTHTSIDPLSVLCVLPKSITAASSKYRSSADDESLAPTPILLKDTPGHAKLRHHAHALLTSPTPLKGIIFVVDSTSLNPSTEDGEPNRVLTETAEYLHDTLLILQRQYAEAKSSKVKQETAFLVAANKLDLFTSLPTNAVRATLENEISKVRETRAKGLLSVGTMGEGLGSTEQEEADEEKDVLGGTCEGKFEFTAMREWNLEIVVEGGNVLGDEGPGVDAWWKWIAEQI